MLKLVLLGPPGSGKGTHAAQLSQLTGAAHISTGDLLRAEVDAGTELGRRVAGYQVAGELVPDSVILAVALPLVEAAAAGSGYVLDGFPRSLRQAQTLDERVPAAARADQIVLLVVPEAELVTRMLVRAGREHRPDDTTEIFGRRLSVYEAETRPVIDYYREQGLLREVDAVGDLDEVTGRIRAALEL